MASAGARLLPWFRVLSARDADALTVAAEPATDERAGALAVTTTAAPGHHSRCPPPPRLLLGSASDASAGVGAGQSWGLLFPSRTLAGGGNDDTESKGGTLGGEEDYAGGRLYRVRRRRRRPRWQRRRHVVWEDNGEEYVDGDGDVGGDGGGDGGRCLDSLALIPDIHFNIYQQRMTNPKQGESLPTKDMQERLVGLTVSSARHAAEAVAAEYPEDTFRNCRTQLTLARMLFNKGPCLGYVKKTLSVNPSYYTLYTPFIHLHYHIYTRNTPIYTYVHLCTPS